MVKEPEMGKIRVTELWWHRSTETLSKSPTSVRIT